MARSLQLSNLDHSWLIWHLSRWAYVIMNCQLCGVIGVIVIGVIYEQSCQLQVWSQKLHILHIHAPMAIVYAHGLVSEYNMYFLNDSHFSEFLYVALLTTWLNLEPLYLAELCTYTGATHRKEIIHLSIIFLKLWIFEKIYILHFLAHWQTCQRY